MTVRILLFIAIIVSGCSHSNGAPTNQPEGLASGRALTLSVAARWHSPPQKGLRPEIRKIIAGDGGFWVLVRHDCAHIGHFSLQRNAWDLPLTRLFTDYDPAAICLLGTAERPIVLHGQQTNGEPANVAGVKYRLLTNVGARESVHALDGDGQFAAGLFSRIVGVHGSEIEARVFRVEESAFEEVWKGPARESGYVQVLCDRDHAFVTVVDARGVRFVTVSGDRAVKDTLIDSGASAMFPAVLAKCEQVVVARWFDRSGGTRLYWGTNVLTLGRVGWIGEVICVSGIAMLLGVDMTGKGVAYALADGQVRSRHLVSEVTGDVRACVIGRRVFCVTAGVDSLVVGELLGL